MGHFFSLQRHLGTRLQRPVPWDLGLGCARQEHAAETQSYGNCGFDFSAKWFHADRLVLFLWIYSCCMKKVTEAHMWAIWASAVDFFEANIV
jgi:hypothetical protein